ncbi:MAG: tRNA pseudouridine(55) synthase TruB [Candidatus Gracilibacteria bacterium]|nr:tRNA pseudouridine(55) synthase TruB [Candidatus Gracilibacteria bacterium]
MNGILLIDKPTGLSSFDILKQIRKKLDVRKVGFLGTLDPLATGLLVFFVGGATKLIKYFEETEKVYEVEMEIGKVSDTYDRTGEISATSAGTRQGTSLRETYESFLGQQWQITPAFSAVKFQGKRAYEHAREGKIIDLGKRQVSIHEIEILSENNPIYSLRVRCSSGTYIRSLVHEMGEMMETGAIMNELRRTHVGLFSVDEAVQVKNLKTTDLRDLAADIIEKIDWKRFAESDKRQLLKTFG